MKIHCRINWSGCSLLWAASSNITIDPNHGEQMETISHESRETRHLYCFTRTDPVSLDRLKIQLKEFKINHEKEMNGTLLNMLESKSWTLFSLLTNLINVGFLADNNLIHWILDLTFGFSCAKTGQVPYWRSIIVWIYFVLIWSFFRFCLTSQKNINSLKNKITKVKYMALTRHLFWLSQQMF